MNITTSNDGAEGTECRLCRFRGYGYVFSEIHDERRHSLKQPGYPMAGQLAVKLPAESRIYVFDVVQESVVRLSQQYPERVIPCSHSKEVADHAVCALSSSLPP